MRPLLLFTCALVLAFPAGSPAMPVFVATPEFVPAVHPVAAPVGYGEWAARYGNFRRGHVHEGQDVFAPSGTPLLAARDAVVIETGTDGGRGNYLALYAREQDETYVYLHMLRPARVAVGDRVAVGERVGLLGCTGSCFGEHLHFEIRRGKGVSGPSRDPLPFLRRFAR